MIRVRLFLLFLSFFVAETGMYASREQDDSLLLAENSRFFSSTYNALSQIVSQVQQYFSINVEQSGTRVRLALNNELSCKEEAFLSMRLKKAHSAIQALIGKKFSLEATPRIGFCFSGGGNRAMVSTLGFLKKADELGLMDASIYMSALSGSTWALAPWIAAGGSIASYLETLAPKLEEGLVFTNTDLILNLSEKWYQWLTSGRFPSAIDLYGDLLANILLTEHNDQKFDLTMSQTHKGEKFLSGDLPLPIYTAIMPKVEPYVWFEFSPFECGSQENRCYIPIEMLGSQFKNGASYGTSYEPSLGYMLGIFGSAFDVSISDLLRIYIERVNALLDPLPDEIQSTIEATLAKAYTSDFGDIRFLPAKLPNYCHNYGAHGLEKFKRLTFVDAGIDFNIPITPLLHPSRALDMLIILDVSANNESFHTLQAAKAYTLTHNLPFPEIDYAQLKEHSCAILHDVRDEKAPIVIYIALAKEDAYNHDFDPIAAMNDGFCSTFNFTYTSAQIDLLSGLAGYRLEKLFDSIVEQIAYIVDKKSVVLL